MFPLGTLNEEFTRLWRRSGTERASRFSNVRRLWLGMLSVSAIVVVGFLGYGVFTFRSLERLAPTTEDLALPQRLLGVFDEDLLRSVRAHFHARDVAHQRLLENPPHDDIIDPAG